MIGANIMNYEKIGQFIARLRRDKSLTQKELATLIGVTDKAISKWERGLGCPDVSLLESLSMVLDVSILEILKGRKISVEDLDTENINDFVLETVQYSEQNRKEKYQKVIKNSLTVFMIAIISFLLFLNIYHIQYLKMTESYDFNNSTVEKMHSNLKILQAKIDEIKNAKLRYTEQDRGELLQNLEESYRYLKENPLLQYKGFQTFHINDLYIIDLYRYSSLSLINGYQILEKYDSSITSYKEHYQTTTITKMLTSHELFIEPHYSYRYRVDFENTNDKVIYKVNARVLNSLYMIEEMIIYCDYIMEVGVSHE